MSRSASEYLKQRIAAAPVRIGLPKVGDTGLLTQQMRYKAAYQTAQAAQRSDGLRQVWSAERLTAAKAGGAICCRTEGPAVIVKEECQCPPLAQTNPVRCGPCKKPVISSKLADPRCCNRNQ